MPPRYKDIEDCRPNIQLYANHLDSSTSDEETHRNEGSTTRYKQDLRWFDEWLDEEGIEDITAVTSGDAAKVGHALTNQFNGTTPRYRWDRIYSLFEWAVRMEIITENPLEKWNATKDKELGLTKSTKQSSELEDEEKYAVSQNEVRDMEENVGPPRLRNQLLIRCLWHTGMRRKEASQVTLDMIDYASREIELPPSITKNGKRRVVAYQPNLDGLLRKWIDEGYREECARGEELPHLFVGTRGAPLSPAAINDVVTKAADNAGFNRKLYADANSPDGEPNRWKVTAHNIRHGLGSYLVNETEMGIYEVSKYLGHASVDITEKIYVEENPRAGTDEAKRYGPS